ncbi:MAG: HAD-IIA family hydrolase [Anaerolineae bacterium]
MGERPGLKDLRGFIFDMDGVIYRGNTVLPGAAEFIAALRRAGIPYLFLTNNSTTPPAAVARRLIGMEIPATADDVLGSAEATAAILAAERPGCAVYVIGEAGIREALSGAGLRLTDDHRQAEAVVVGMDRDATYARLRDAALAIQRGAAFIATNTDRSLPTEEGLIPGAGALVGMLEIATGVKARAIGKPEPGIFHLALHRLGTPAELTAVVGDRPETDILGGRRAGLRTIAVLTGVGTAEDFAALQPGPDWVFPDLQALRRAYFDT